MNEDSLLLIGLHKLAQQNGDGIAPALHDRLMDAYPESHTADIIALPGLHQRPSKPMYGGSPRGEAKIIRFPAPKWQKNAARNSG